MPPLIALPGTLLDGRSLSAALAGRGARIEWLGTCPTLDDELDRLAEMAKVAGGPAWWAGHSLGGIVALQLAARHPDVVAGLVLLAANARAAPATARVRRAAQWQAAQAHGLRTLVQCKLGPGYGLQPGDALLQSLADQADAVGMARFGRQLTYASQRPGLAERAPWIGVPVLALSAADDSLCPPEQSDEIMALVMPGVACQHHRLARAGHLFPMQHAAWVAARLHAFMMLFAHERITP